MPSGSGLGSLPGAQPPRSPWISIPGPEKQVVARARVGVVALAGLARGIDVGQQ